MLDDEYGDSSSERSKSSPLMVQISSKDIVQVYLRTVTDESKA
jgi:hypothetical protein